LVKGKGQTDFADVGEDEFDGSAGDFGEVETVLMGFEQRDSSALSIRVGSERCEDKVQSTQ
jgi:hypothetical protein